MPSPSPSTAPPGNAEQNIDILGLLNAQLTTLVGNALPCVVSIQGYIELVPGATITGIVSHPPNDTPTFIPLHVSVTGSGFLLQGGIVVTTAEVVSGMSDPYVVLSEGRRIKATGINEDLPADVAILRVPGMETRPVLHWGDPTKVSAGSLAVTIGNQCGFAGSASLGMIAATDRRAHSPENGRHYEHLMQFQGALGAGGSGSPVLDTHGDVIGMVIGAASGPQPEASGRYNPRYGLSTNSFSASNGTEKSANPSNFLKAAGIPGGSNMGLALPSDRVRMAVDVLVKNIRSLRAAGWLGLLPRRGHDIELIVGDVYAGSPAEKAGIQPGDGLISIAGEPIHSYQNMRQVVEQLVEGEELTMEVRRDGKILPLRLHIIPRPDDSTFKHLARHSLPSHSDDHPHGNP